MRKNELGRSILAIDFEGAGNVAGDEAGKEV